MTPAEGAQVPKPVLTRAQLKQARHNATFQEGAQTPAATHLFEALDQALRTIDEREARLKKINDTIYSVGAPIGSDSYHTIRDLAVFKYGGKHFD